MQTHLRTLDRQAEQKARTAESLLVALVLAGVLVALAPLVHPRRPPADPEELIQAGAWWLAVVVGSWWAVSALVWSISLGSRRPPSSVLRRITAPSARRLAEALFASSLVVVPSCAPADIAGPTMSIVDAPAAEPSPDTPSPAPPTSTAAPSSTSAAPATTIAGSTTAPTTTAPTTTAPTTTVLPTTAPPTTALPTTAPPTTLPPTTAATGSPTDDGPRGDAVTVRPGDSLWSIAVDTLRVRTGGEPDVADVADYWREMLTINTVRSGDHDLIVPGEVIRLPAATVIGAGESVE